MQTSTTSRFDSRPLRLCRRRPLHLSFRPSPSPAMSSSPFRNWRRASRKSSVPFFPGAWPNSSAHDSIVTKSEREAVDAQELSDTAIGDHVAQLGQGTSSLPSGSSRSEASHYRSEATHRKSDEPLLQHIDHVTDFHRRLSHSLNYSQSGSIGSIPTEVDLQMVSSRTVSSFEDNVRSTSLTRNLPGHIQ